MRGLVSSIALCALLTPAVAAAQDSEDIFQPSEPEVHAGMMIAGGASLVGSYGFSALVGLELLTYESSPGTYCENCTTEGARLLIPVLGPFLAIPKADGTDGKVVCGVLGVAQATGLVLGLAGVTRFKHDLAAKRAWREAQGAQGSWRLSPIVASAGPDQASVPGLALDVTF